MQLPRRNPTSSSTSAFLILFLVIHTVTAQGLPKLNDATTEASAATSGDTTPTKTAANGGTKTTGQSAAATTAAAAATSDAPALSGLPKLAGDDYPPPTVPPTANAPFMQKSNLPEGTVFICVGAALGFLGFLVLAWRGLVAWSLHRSVKRAAIAQSAKYSQIGGGRGPSGSKKSPYFSPGPGSTMSLDQLGVSGKNTGNKSPSAHNSLFFSPTAGTQLHAHGNRGSGYLPAGYYASGNSAPGGGSGMTHIGGGSRPLSNLSNQGARYSRSRSAEPPGPASPSLPASRGRDSALGLPPSRGGETPYGRRLSTQGIGAHASNSSLNLSVAPQSRAPSAYLEDLFENHPPGSLPPEEIGSGSRRR